MTYATEAMDDRVDACGRPWDRDTFRIFHSDERQRWSVSTPYDDMHGTAYCSWADHGGEFFDGVSWLPLADRSFDK